jgi:hypothetical protein
MSAIQPKRTDGRRNGRRPLWEDIRRFKKTKILLAVIFLSLGVLGFILPVIPGFLFILLAVAMLRPGMMKKIRNKLKEWNV